MNKSITLNFKVVDDKKKKRESTIIIDLLKKHGVPGGVAVNIYKTNRAEYIIRKCFLYEYYATVENKPILSGMKWVQHAIRNDYNEPDHFNNWYKSKKEYILANGNDDLKRLVGI